MICSAGIQSGTTAAGPGLARCVTTLCASKKGFTARLPPRLSCDDAKVLPEAILSYLAGHVTCICSVHPELQCDAVNHVLTLSLMSMLFVLPVCSKQTTVVLFGQSFHACDLYHTLSQNVWQWVYMRSAFSEVCPGCRPQTSCCSVTIVFMTSLCCIQLYCYISTSLLCCTTIMLIIVYDYSQQSCRIHTLALPSASLM